MKGRLTGENFSSTKLFGLGPDLIIHHNFTV